ncbi:DUF4238 domain-containing protein [Ralstonia soli]|uniref:DUF4238 domain-containing protein n=1 Tax=Ralstonia soli TaxID=2953896 RepID=A0ABT1AJY5_9RALS|nr:DUF4238 domain-containing protein [Ralstonia soli]MCO5398574.1 DUF4238 domain-containing protein [Ralstonia soli]
MADRSVKHHYVPEWYQRRFLAPGATAFKILDLHPEIYRNRFGAEVGRGKIILEKGPSAFFYEKDFYTVRWFGQANDDIERLLFGTIDREGARAISAFIAEDWETVHHTYWQMFEFMDALRLRTPKGLRFVHLLREARNQQELMISMQKMRRMHCVMWAEGVLEIVSAAQSPTKFIFSDHPVTLFNREVFPADARVPTGFDPHLAWVGTQTLFPFDRDRLFVLTHLEWARSKGKAKPTESRTNARYFDNPMVRYDNCIRGRELSEQQVSEVNYIIKMRAERYIAANSESDLFPERVLKTRAWNKLGRFLMPTRALHGFGGDMFAQLGNGSIYFQDEFGRRPKTSSEAEARTKEAQSLIASARKLIAAHEAKNGLADSHDIKGGE